MFSIDDPSLKVSGNIDYKTKRCPGTGMQLTSKWSTDNVLNTSLDLQDKLMSGLSLTLDSFYNPDTGSKNGKLKAELKTAAALLTLDTDLNLGGPILNTSAVIGHKVSWLNQSESSIINQSETITVLLKPQKCFDGQINKSAEQLLTYKSTLSSVIRQLEISIINHH